MKGGSLILVPRVEGLGTELYRVKSQSTVSGCAVCGNGDLQTVGHVALDCK